MSGRLAVEDFPEFFTALWGFAPFPWQTALAQQVSVHGWPKTLELPTAAGKTAVLDIALFALALESELPPARRRAPLRIVLVVDRRVIVDQAARRAGQLAVKLQQAKDGLLAAVARALRRGRGEKVAPVVNSVLRGGIPRETEWARSPDQPCILVSTVDQVGSRLLFRGYGVSDTMLPVHAGLLGEDVLYLLDEVHLSRPFAQTLSSVQRLASSEWEGVPHRFEIVSMSATPGIRPPETFGLKPADYDHPKLGPRLRASKKVCLKTVQTPKDPGKARDLVAQACLAEANRLLSLDGVKVVAVIVNRVDTARRIARLAEPEEARLLTGRMRPLDRDDLLREVEPSVLAGRTRASTAPLLLVSTQAIEAGADFDFDAMVSECASLDALRQRFGRVDRLGTLGESQGAILIGTDQLAENAQDPIYGDALKRTWQWLEKLADGSSVVDFGTVALEAHLQAQAGEVAELLPPSSLSPVLLPTHLELWSQTSPRLEIAPDVASFLHGPEAGPADVQIVWRSDLKQEWLERACDDERWARTVREVVGAVPPSPLEALSVPPAAARSWLRNLKNKASSHNPVLADVEGGPGEEAGPESQMMPVVVWTPKKSVVVCDSSDIWPGATLIVPSTYGGIRNETWDPESDAPVDDRGDEAQLLYRGLPVLRWSAESWLGGPKAPEETDLEYDVQAESDAFTEWLVALSEVEWLPAWARVATESLRQSKRRRIIRIELPSSEGETSRYLRSTVAKARLTRNERRALLRNASLETEAATEGDGGLFTGARVPLRKHLEDVGELAAQYAHSVGLEAGLLEATHLAGRLHDLGKADPRFQLMLYGGDPILYAAAKDQLVAKSEIPSADRQARRQARKAAKYPDGGRHELLSVALLQQAGELLEHTREKELVLHLIASHHGYCRPFPPPILDDAEETVALVVEGVSIHATTAHTLCSFGSPVPERFWQAQRKLGWWRLAWLETILRLADHRVSEREAEGGNP